MDGKEMLSQEEIDALLRQGREEREEQDRLEDYLTPLEIDALGEIGNITYGNASTALSTLLGQKVDITTPTVSLIKKEELEQIFPYPYVAVQVEYTKGFIGTNILVLQTRDAGVIADLMMGGNGENPPEQLSEMELSACQEAMNQMMGSAATSMSTLFHRMVNISPPKVDILDIPAGKPKIDLLEEERLIKIAFQLRIGKLIDSSIMLLLRTPFAKALAESLLSGNPLEEEEPVANPERKSEARLEIKAESKPEMRDSTLREETELIRKEARPEPSSFGGRPEGRPSMQVQPVQFANLDQSQANISQNGVNLNLLMDIPLQVTVELGRTKRFIREILELGPGSILELDKLAGEPVDIFVNNKLIAKGEVVVIDENFGVRVTEIISQWERIQKL